MSTRLQELKNKFHDQNLAQKGESFNDKTFLVTSSIKCSLTSSVRRFSLLFKDGRQVALSYSTLPIYKLEANGNIHIDSHDFNIIIKGRNLSQVMDWLCEEKLVQIKESGTGIDMLNEDDAFVSFISYKNKLDSK